MSTFQKPAFRQAMRPRRMVSCQTQVCRRCGETVAAGQEVIMVPGKIGAVFHPITSCQGANKPVSDFTLGATISAVPPASMLPRAQKRLLNFDALFSR